MCAIRATATITTTTQRREREKKNIVFDVILIERAVLLVLFSVFFAL